MRDNVTDAVQMSKGGMVCAEGFEPPYLNKESLIYSQVPLAAQPCTRKKWRKKGRRRPIRLRIRWFSRPVAAHCSRIFRKFGGREDS
jgi:hypothetical protein